MGDIASNEILTFLRDLGGRYQRSANLYLLGGSALCLLGSTRRTLDIDYTLEMPADLSAELQAAINTLAIELRLDVEFVPIHEFIPLPADAETRHRIVGQFGNVTVFVFDPYSIALGKLARGHEEDLVDITFLMRLKLVDFEQLETYAKALLTRAAEFDIDPKEFERNMRALRRTL